MNRWMCVVAVCLAWSISVAPVAGEDLEFNRDIRPILSDKCFACHGPDAEHREAELRLDQRESVIEDRGDYAVIVPNQPDRSELVRRIRTADNDERMPPPETGKPLSERERELLERWVKEGAVFQDYWAYVPPKPSTPPDTRDRNWPRNWIDNYILARLEREQLKPSPPASQRTLFRRLHLDLIGLPPTPEAVDEFVSATEVNRDKAYEAAVDQLLASPRFGERLAIYWLDLVRYADTVGYHGDQDHSISPYRDYVIDALNRNVPFDQFTREQLAGDLLPVATIESRVASGYNRLLQTSHEGGVQPREYRAMYAADRVRNVSAVWMGATMGCCQCHDHKFDPYSARDFYAMAAFFADIDDEQHLTAGTNSLPTKRPPEITVLSRHQREHLTTLQEQLADTPDDQPSTRIKLREQIDQIKKSARPSMITVALETPRVTRVFPRGDWLNETGPIVMPAVPRFLPAPKQVTGSRMNRLELANWLTDPTDGVGGLTARVFVNRIWYLFLGAGLSPSLDDFGGQGAPPSHPELLDQLAVDFYEHDWNIKRIIKQIVMSRTYQQSSVPSQDHVERDPPNRLFGRQARFRLPAELVRDNALAISGLLFVDYRGVSVRPYQPPGYYRHLNFPTRKYASDPGSRQWARGVYVHWQRQFLHPMFKAFDAPRREECTAKRPKSNTPLAALTLLNDPSFVESARVFAEQVVRHETDGGRRLTLAFRRAVAREPDSTERLLFERLLESRRAYFESHPKAAQEAVHIGVYPIDEELRTAEVAVWMGATRALLNMQETVTRN